SSDVCSSDLDAGPAGIGVPVMAELVGGGQCGHVGILRKDSVEARVGGDGQEVGEHLGVAEAVEQANRLGDAVGAGDALAMQPVGQRQQGAFQQVEVDRRAVVELQWAQAVARVVQPLPQLGAGDLGGGRVLHQVVD